MNNFINVSIEHLAEGKPSADKGHQIYIKPTKNLKLYRYKRLRYIQSIRIDISLIHI